MNKDKNLFSEIASFYSKSDKDYAMKLIGDIIKNVKFSENKLFASHARDRKPNELFHYTEILQIMLLFPSFRVNNPSHYPDSDLYRILSCHKDTFYRFLKDGTIDWRSILYNITYQLWHRIEVQNRIDHAGEKKHGPVVFIVDDSDIAKTSYGAELTSRIFSHAQHKYIPGYKHLSLAINDGKTLMNLDAQLMRESKKSKDKAYGMTREQAESQFKEDYGDGSAILGRMSESEEEKPEVVMKMTSRAIKHHFRADYMLSDSWFTSKKLIDFCVGHHMNFLGMVKLGKTQYSLVRQGQKERKLYSASTLAQKLWKEERTNPKKKHHKKFGYYYMECNVWLQDREVRLFFMRKNKNAKWNVLLTSNLKLHFQEAYRIYSMRWAIEVSYGDEKGLLGLENCRERTFAAQVAHETLTCLTYNILALVKRYSCYETIGKLFRCSLEGAVKLSITEEIWGVIQEIAMAIAEDENYPQTPDEVIDSLVNHLETVKTIQGICEMVS